MLIHSLNQSFRMATTAFICDMGDSEESVRSLQLKQRGCSYTLLQVLVGVLAVLVLAMTGGIIWMKMSQNCQERYCPERYSMLRFTRINNFIETDFTSPTEGEYEIRGNISIKPIKRTQKNCYKTIQLLEKLVNGTDRRILEQRNPEVIKTVKLEEGSGLRIRLNSREFEIDEAKSYLIVYQKTCL